MIYELNSYQNEFYTHFKEAIEDKTDLIYNSNAIDRGIGKTTIVNMVGYDCQAVGYEVYVLTPISCIEYYAGKRISDYDYDLRGIKRGNAVMLVDEADSSSDLFSKVCDFCAVSDIVMVGFAR